MNRGSASPVRTVLMTADAVGGVWSYAVQLSERLARRGLSVVLATMGPAPTDGQRRALAALGIGHVHGDFRLEWMPGAAADRREAEDWLLDLERRHRPDIVHLNGYCHGAAPFAAPKLVVAHSCVLSWWHAVHGEVPPADWDGYGLAVSGGLREADAVVAPTAAFLELLEGLYGRLPHASVIHNGRGPDGFGPAHEKEPVILCAGRLWDQAKNIGSLDEIAPDLAWPVLVAGDDRAPDGRLAASSHLQALGRLDEATLARWMGRASVFVSPARYEPFGLAVLEAALSGCALVLGDIPSFRELWDDAALFVDPDDGKGLHDALNRIIRNAELRAKLAAAARGRGLSFPADRMADDTLALYRRLAASRRPVFAEAGPAALEAGG